LQLKYDEEALSNNAFNFNLRPSIQDAVGYFLHSLLLVPYFSWQRSHAVHHSRTNHLTEVGRCRLTLG